jgi:hypothetical protein
VKGRYHHTVAGFQQAVVRLKDFSEWIGPARSLTARHSTAEDSINTRDASSSIRLSDYHYPLFNLNPA